MVEAFAVRHRTRSNPCRTLALLAGAVACAAEAESAERRRPDGGAVFADGFESAECSAWSATSNPTAAPDADADDFGDEAAPAAVCALPVGFVFDATDCDDGDDTIFPGSTEVCNGLDDDCDGTPDDGLRDTNPGCATAVNLGSVAGDLAGAPLQSSGFTEKWFLFTLSESSISSVDLRARVTLQVPALSDFDLHVYCASCGGTPVGSSTNPGSAEETVEIRTVDGGGDNSTIYRAEVRYFSGAGCTNWTLSVLGNTGTGTASCP